MQGIKKLQLSLFAILVSTSFSQAQAAAPDRPIRQNGGWYVDLEVFHAKANDSLLNEFPFASTIIRESSDIPGGGTLFTADSIIHRFHDPDFEWGYRVAGGYDYPSCNSCTYGFSIEYTYHQSKDSAHLANFINSEGIPSVDDYWGFFDADATNADANYKYRYHALDLLGHKNMTVCCVDVQLFAGARYVHLNEDFHRHLFVPADLVDDILVNIGTEYSDYFTDHDSKFNGIGPRIGVNTFYQVANGFGLVTEVAGNLLFGLSDASYSERVTDIENIGGGTLNITENTHHNKVNDNGHIVPGLSGKVALAYRTIFSNCGCSSLMVELGYRGDKYFNIANHAPINAAGNFTGVFIKDGNYHDFDIAGPYLSASYHF